MKTNETNWEIGDIIKVKLYKKGIDLKKLDLENPIFIQGASGIGNVGLIAVRHMITEAKARPLFEVMNLDMPSVAFVQDGLFADWSNIFSVTVYLWRRPSAGRDLLFSCSYTQPLTPMGSNIIAHVLLKNLEDMGVKELVSLGCFGTNNYVKKPKVYVSTTSKDALGDFERIDNVVPLRDGRISGLNGIMPLMASSYDMLGVSLLAEGLSRISFNPRSSKVLIEVLNARYDLNIDLGALDVYSEKLEKEIEKLKLRLPAEQIGVPEPRPGTDVDSYYT
ncbi:MAG: PAC2 family protein [Candidatus Jordarchaeum sp.]|uniref:PAC2 family protein n=1 Tax=Candidatus Jordarchaeum sp. TaxID=2823881 RepID=UPI0040495420